MNRKDKTVKQLQAECRKKKVGFMMNWTKVALIKRLEDEDTRDKSILDLQKELDKSKETVRIKEKDTQDLKIVLQKRETEITKALNAAPTPAQLTKKAVEGLIQSNKAKLSSLQKSFDTLHERQLLLTQENNEIIEKKLAAWKKMETIKELMANLK